jgi:hypothetical protein
VESRPKKKEKEQLHEYERRTGGAGKEKGEKRG